MGSRQRKLKANFGNRKLKDGKTVGGRGRLDFRLLNLKSPRGNCCTMSWNSKTPKIQEDHDFHDLPPHDIISWDATGKIVKPESPRRNCCTMSWNSKTPKIQQDQCSTQHHG